MRMPKLPPFCDFGPLPLAVSPTLLPPWGWNIAHMMSVSFSRSAKTIVQPLLLQYSVTGMDALRDICIAVFV
jgi:hypothetical protein